MFLRVAFLALVFALIMAMLAASCLPPPPVPVALALIGPPYRWDDRLTLQPAPTLATGAPTRAASRTPTPSPTGTRARPTRAQGTPTATQGHAAPWPTCGLCTGVPIDETREVWPQCAPLRARCTITPTDTPYPTATWEPTPTLRPAEPVPAQPIPVPTPTATLMLQSGAATMTAEAGRELLIFPVFRGRGVR